MIVGVYGLGRFGAFWASLLARRYDVVGYSRSNSRQTPPQVRRVSEEQVLQSDVLFLCVSISAMREVARAIAPRLAPGTLVVDTCSVKVEPVRAMVEELAATQPILATHPMFGPDSAANGVAGLPIVVWPVRVDWTRHQFWQDEFAGFGLRVLQISPDDHDHEAAYTQGITHFIGRVLGDMELRGSEIGTLGYRRILQVIEQTCNDPWQLFLDLQRYNPYTREMRERLRTSLTRVLEKLESSLDST
jgi:prephenate dehydrogenase